MMPDGLAAAPNRFCVPGGGLTVVPAGMPKLNLLSAESVEVDLGAKSVEVGLEAGEATRPGCGA